MMGLFLENGPYWIDDDGSVNMRNASWNNNFDVLYVDQPAGTGFSVAQSPDAYATNQDDVAEAFSAFLANFYHAHPDSRTKQLWLTGESYAGKYDMQRPLINTCDMVSRAGTSHRSQLAL